MGNWGEVVKKFREYKRLTQGELAERAGIERSHLSRMENGDYDRFTQETIEKLARGLEMAPEQLAKAIFTNSLSLDEIIKYEPEPIIKVPVLGVVPAGYPFPETEETTGEFIEVPVSLLKGVKGPIYALKISGNSLIGDHIENRDYVVIEKSAPLIDGKLYIVLLNNNEVAARHVHKLDDHLRLAASNSEYADIKATDASLLGRVRLGLKYREF